MRKTGWMGLLLAAGCGPLAAQQVWRCGNNSYSDAPCPGGAAVRAAPRPSQAEAERASAHARRDFELADRLERERLAREARAPAAVIPPEPRPAAQPASSAKGKPKAKGRKGGKDGDGPFTAIAPR